MCVLIFNLGHGGFMLSDGWIRLFLYFNKIQGRQIYNLFLLFLSVEFCFMFRNSWLMSFSVVVFLYCKLKNTAVSAENEL